MLSQTSVIWIMLCALLIMLQQAGFLCLESGLCRQKNHINVAAKNFIDFCVVMLCYVFLGHIIVGTDPAAKAWLFDVDAMDTDSAGHLLLMALFCCTAVTIISGAVAERMKIAAYLVIAAVTALIIFPVVEFAVWNSQGWLKQLGFYDFAGATVVHMLGGMIALVTASVLGPRVGVFDQLGRHHATIPSSLVTSTLGAVLLLVGWLGFNGAGASGLDAVTMMVIFNTLISACAGLTVVILVCVLSGRGFDVQLCIVGMLAGLVAVTGGVAVLSPVQAVIVASLGAIAAVLSRKLLVHFRIDDPVDAIPVHLTAALLGTLILAIFVESISFQTQLIGALAVCVWVLLIISPVLWLLKRFNLLRASLEDELQGLNISEHGARSELYDLIRAMQDNHASGNHFKPLPVDPYSDIGLLADRYNGLSAQVATSHQQLQLKADELEQASTVKNDFLSVLNHELRTPINAIKGFTQLLIKGNRLAANDREYLNRIEHASNALTTMTDDLLDIKSIGDESVDLELSQFAMARLLAELESVFTHVANAKTLDFNISNTIASDALMRTDYSALFRILNKLLDNAFKFTEKGQIELRLRIEGEFLLFEIEDSGCGFDDESAQRVFDAFSQNDMALSRHQGGLGLGLSIAKKWSLALGGSIRLRSDLGIGSCFCLQLPTDLLEFAEGKGEQETYFDLHGLHCLVAEDTPDNQFLIEMMLEDNGISCDIANNGQEAVNLMLANPSAYAFVLMDMQMPVMDGIEATELIRESFSSTVLPIVALTANTASTYKQACFDAGMDDFLTKPLDENDLLRALMAQMIRIESAKLKQA